MSRARALHAPPGRDLQYALLLTESPTGCASGTGLAALRQNSLSPSEFEEALAALCGRDGCTDVRVVGGSGDLGADVIARAPDGRRVVLQAKRYHNGRSVGSQDVQRFGGTAHTIHGADVAAVVTTAHAFTQQARAYADKVGILLMPARALAAWESQTGPTPWD